MLTISTIYTHCHNIEPDCKLHIFKTEHDFFMGVNSARAGVLYDYEAETYTEEATPLELWFDKDVAQFFVTNNGDILVLFHNAE